MKTIRFGVFETNSSSVHSLTIVPEDEKYKAWLGGSKELFFDDNGKNKFLTKEEVIKEISEGKYSRNTKEELEQMDDKEFEHLASNYELLTVEKYNQYCEDYEEFEQKFTTPSGDKMVAFGFSGRDG